MCEYCKRFHQLAPADQTECEALSHALGGSKLVLQNASAYSDVTDSYWSLKNVEVHPACVALPESAQDVSTALKTLSLGATVWKDRCQFAVKGGGYVSGLSSPVPANNDQ